MTERIVFENGTTFICSASLPISIPKDRKYRRLTVTSTAAEVKAAFVDNATYHREWDSDIFNENGEVIGTEVLTEDLSDYSIAGDVVDTRDGNITVFMGKKTEIETLQEAFDNLVLEVLEGSI